MKIQHEQAQGKNAVTGYGEGYVEVNRTRHTSSVLVSGDRVEAGWPVGSVAELGADHMAAILELGPEIVLIGTGARLDFPEPAKLAPLYRAGVGVEVMDTPAACRTYNILLGEGRNVVAAVILGSDPAGV